MAVTINASTSAGLVQTADTTGILQLQTANTTAVTVDTSQNVGIGTASPTSQLAVQTTAGSSTGFLKFTDVTYGGDVRFGKNTGISNNVRFFASGAEAMRIDSGGNVLINATSSFGNGPKLQSTGVANSAAAAAFKPGTNGNGTVEWYNASGTYVGAITVNASTVVYGGTSDYRLKDNITSMTGALDKIAQLKPVTYTWKATGEAGEGFIAHELQEVIPSAVVGEKDAVNQDGSIKPQEIDTSFLVATLTAAIQEQTQIINDLKARIETLEGAA
jgi:hypothetical protein